MSTFTPPVAYDNPPILPDSRGMANRLFRYFKNRARYIAVFLLSDNTFVQDTPNGTAPDGSTVSVTNTNIPYPWNPWTPNLPYSTSYYTDFNVNPPVPTVTTASQNPWIKKVYYGPTTVTASEATLLSNAGYSACIS